jgi:hypothetical protein
MFCFVNQLVYLISEGKRARESSDRVSTGFGPAGFLEQRLSVGSLSREGVLLNIHQGVLAMEGAHAISDVVFDGTGAHQTSGTAVRHPLGLPTLDASLANTARVVVLATVTDVPSSGAGTFITCSFRFKARRTVLVLATVFGAVPFASKDAGRNLSKERAQVLNRFHWFHWFRFLVLQ